MQPCIPALAAEAATAPSKVIHVNIGWTTEAPEAPEMETALLSTWSVYWSFLCNFPMWFLAGAGVCAQLCKLWEEVQRMTKNFKELEETVQ